MISLVRNWVSMPVLAAGAAAIDWWRRQRHGVSATASAISSSARTARRPRRRHSLQRSLAGCRSAGSPPAADVKEAAEASPSRPSA